MKLYRSIALKDGQEIDWQNIGASWTMCPILAENLAKDRFPEAVRIIVLSAEFTDSEIDWEYTIGQMVSEYFDAELEAVINDQVDKLFKIELDTDDEIEDEKIEGSTGYSQRDETMCEYNEDEEEKTMSEMITEWKQVLSEV